MSLCDFKMVTFAVEAILAWLKNKGIEIRLRGSEVWLEYFWNDSLVMIEKLVYSSQNNTNIVYSSFTVFLFTSAYHVWCSSFAHSSSASETWSLPRLIPRAPRRRLSPLVSTILVVFTTTTFNFACIFWNSLFQKTNVTKFSGVLHSLICSFLPGIAGEILEKEGTWESVQCSERQSRKTGSRHKYSTSVAFEIEYKSTIC